MSSDEKLKDGERVVLCHCCDHPVIIPKDAHGYLCCCPHCGAVLKHAVIHPFKTGALIAVSALMLLFCSLAEPFLSIDASGLTSTIYIVSMFDSLRGVWMLLATVFLMTAFVFPCLMLLILCVIGFTQIKITRFLANLYDISRSFCFVDVFALGVGISLIKITALADVAFHTGFYIYLIFSVMIIWCWSRFPSSRVWDLVEYEHHQEIAVEPDRRGAEQCLMVCRHCGLVYKADKGHDEARCPRCQALNSYRQRMWSSRVVALVLAAAIMFLPSNIYPVMIVTLLGADSGSNIVQGAIAIWSSGSYFVALVIIIASLFIPGFKILAMVYLTLKVKHGNVTNPRLLSGLYRIVEFIGKWSMIDVFVVIIMTAAVHFSGLMTIAPGMAIIAFCSVVFITIFAASSFDERLIWDNYVGRE